MQPLLHPLSPSGPARLRELLRQLEPSQYWEPGRIAAFTALRIAALCRHAASTVEGYSKPELARAIRNLRLGDLSAWQVFPILTRADLQRHPARYVSTAASGRPLHWHATTGSTGIPVWTTGDEHTQLFWRALTLRDHGWHSRHYGGRLCVIRDLTGAGDARAWSETVLPDWGSPVNELYQSGPSFCMPTSTPAEPLLAWLENRRPDYLLTHPPIVEALARLHLRRRSRFALTEVRTFGNVLDEETRRLCFDAFGARVTDIYSSNEAGHIALQCPVTGLYHAQSENVFVEVIREDGSYCEEGDTGRVLLTTLQNFTMPLLRYDIGDYAEVAGRCRCGRTLPALKQVIGRKRNLFVTPEGTCFWPRVLFPRAQVLSAQDIPIEQFRVVQTSRQDIVVRLKWRHAPSSADRQRLREVAAASLPGSLTLNFEDVAGFEDPCAGKIEDFRSEVWQD